VIDHAALFGPAVAHGDWWRIVTAGFLHAGILHIGLNMYVLFILGTLLEPGIGTPRFLGVYFVSLLAGSFGALLLTPRALTVGASGAIFGVMGAVVVILHRHRDLFVVRDKRIGVVVAAWAGYTLFLGLFQPMIDNAAHLGGLLAGLALGLLAPLPMLAPQPWHRPVLWFLIASAFALFSAEGAAVAWAARPKPRTLKGAHVEAQVPGLLAPEEPGLALLPGAAAVEIGRDDEALTISPGDDALHIGDRTWVHESEEKDGKEIVRLAAADGSGRLVIEFACGADFCRGEKGRLMYELTARTIRTMH
jgi:membrane associated rhomboid family serine protease